MKTVAMIGAGAWGTAVSNMLADNGYRVNLWCYETALVKTILTSHENITFLPDVLLSHVIIPTHCLATALKNVEEVFFAVPVQYSRTVLEQCRSFYKKEQTWIFLSKGIEQGTLLVPSHIADQVFDCSVSSAVVMGPSFAKDLADKKLTGVMCACADSSIYEKVKKLLCNDYFKLFPSDDLVGVQLCAALKNVVALGVGMLEGQGCVDNTKIFFIMSLLKELEEVVSICGGKVETVFGLAGIGDIMLTAFSVKSRNYTVGKCLGQGKKLSDILNSIDALPEGINTVHSLYALLQNQNIDAPLCKKVYQNLSQKTTFFDTVKF